MLLTLPYAFFYFYVKKLLLLQPNFSFIITTQSEKSIRIPGESEGNSHQILYKKMSASSLGVSFQMRGNLQMYVCFSLFIPDGHHGNEIINLCMFVYSKIYYWFWLKNLIYLFKLYTYLYKCFILICKVHSYIHVLLYGI